MRYGLLLAFAAWLMQLSVFLTPILSHQIGVGYGVCDELAVLSQPNVDSGQSKNDVHHDDMSSMSMADMPGMMDMQASKPAKPIVTTSASNHTSKSAPVHDSNHDSHHGQCDFCLLFGHSVLPPLHTITLVLVSITVTVSAAQIDAIRFLFKQQNKNLRPQGRAPPVFIL